jgi:hypothetical protein
MSDSTGARNSITPNTSADQHSPFALHTLPYWSRTIPFIPFPLFKGDGAVYWDYQVPSSGKNQLPRWVALRTEDVMNAGAQMKIQKTIFRMAFDSIRERKKDDEPDNKSSPATPLAIPMTASLPSPVA